MIPVFLKKILIKEGSNTDHQHKLDSEIIDRRGSPMEPGQRHALEEASGRVSESKREEPLGVGV